MKKIDWNAAGVRIFFFLAMGYFIYLTYNAVMINYKTNKKIAELKAEIALDISEKEYLNNLNSYYATGTYKELEARRKLGFKKPDEKVIKISVDPQRLAQLENREVINQPTNNTESINESNAYKWFKFIFRL